MPRHLLLAVMFLISAKCVKSDILLSTFKSELKDWAESLPKVWMSYIRMHLFKYIKKNTAVSQCAKNIVWQILNRAKSLLLINKQTTVNNKCISKCILMYPIGQFILYFYTDNPNYLFVNWNLNPSLHLNLTFFVIDLFPSKYHYDYDYHYYYQYLYHYFEHSTAHLIIVQGISIASKPQRTYYENEYEFHGHYSTFTFYSKNIK